MQDFPGAAKAVSTRAMVRDSVREPEPVCRSGLPSNMASSGWAPAAPPGQRHQRLHMLLHPRQIQQIPISLSRRAISLRCRQLGALFPVCGGSAPVRAGCGSGQLQPRGRCREQAALLLLDHVFEGVDHATTFRPAGLSRPPPQVGILYFQVALGELGDRPLQLRYGAGQAPGEQQTEKAGC